MHSALGARDNSTLLMHHAAGLGLYVGSLTMLGTQELRADQLGTHRTRCTNRTTASRS